jgi:hypothetical protein
MRQKPLSGFAGYSNNPIANRASQTGFAANPPAGLCLMPRFPAVCRHFYGRILPVTYLFFGQHFL